MAGKEKEHDAVVYMLNFSHEWRKHPLLYDSDFRNAQQRKDNMGTAKLIRKAKVAMAKHLGLTGRRFSIIFKCNFWNYCGPPNKAFMVEQVFRYFLLLLRGSALFWNATLDHKVKLMRTPKQCVSNKRFQPEIDAATCQQEITPV